MLRRFRPSLLLFLQMGLLLRMWVLLLLPSLPLLRVPLLLAEQKTGLP